MKDKKDSKNDVIVDACDKLLTAYDCSIAVEVVAFVAKLSSYSAKYEKSSKISKLSRASRLNAGRCLYTLVFNDDNKSTIDDIKKDIASYNSALPLYFNVYKIKTGILLTTKQVNVKCVVIDTYRKNLKLGVVDGISDSSIHKNSEIFRCLCNDVYIIRDADNAVLPALTAFDISEYIDTAKMTNHNINIELVDDVDSVKNVDVSKLTLI